MTKEIKLLAYLQAVDSIALLAKQCEPIEPKDLVEACDEMAKQLTILVKGMKGD